MLQNVSDENIKNQNIDEDSRIILMLKEMFKPHNCIIYILTFLVSMVKIQNEILPFGLSILAACMGSTVPIFIVYIISFISVGIFGGSTGLATYFYTSIIFLLLVFLFRPKVSLDDRNEIFKVGSRIFLASFLYNLIQNIRGVFLLYNVFLGFIIASLTYVFYKIFVNGIVVIRDAKEKKAFTVEEVIAASIIFAIAFSVFNKVTIFSLSISNILIIFIVMCLGWKNGMLVGGTAGVSIGLALTLIGNFTLLQLLVFAVAGILAGFLNKFGKIGVIVGFLLGNAILTYLSTGNLVTIIYFREIFIAALGLLLVPSNLKIEIEDLIGREKYFPTIVENRFGYYEDVKEKLNAVVNVISDMNNNFSISGKDENELTEEIFLDNFFKNIEEYQENIFYDDVINNEELIRDIYRTFKDEDIITENIMINIFKKYNNYILLRDQKLKNDLQELIKIANRTYRELQIRRIKADTKRDEALKLRNELKNVTNIIKDTSEQVENENSAYKDKEKEIYILLKSKEYNIINVRIKECQNGKMLVKLELKYVDETIRDKSKILNIADIISKSIGKRFSFQKDRKNLSTGAYFQLYSSDDKYAIQVGSAKISKDGNSISGDSNLQIRLEDGKYLLAISDGMGSGEKAKENSKLVINTLNKLMAKGFDNLDVLNLVNSELNLKKRNEAYATVDMSILDLYVGEMLIIKNGACNTYIKNKKSVNIYTSKNMPIGILEDVTFNEEKIQLSEGDIILMCSDGLLESKDETRKDWIEEFLKKVNTNNVQKIADLVLQEAIDNSFGIVKDDITVIVTKIIKRK